VKIIFTISIATTPFNPSSSKVAMASFLFPVRRTLVAPIFPDPISRISPYPPSFVRISPKGIEPRR
jgi:hypothetical protein